MRLPLNLASHPFGNQRLPNLLTGAAAVVIVALTLAHGVLLVRVLPGGVDSALTVEVGELEAELVQLKQAERSLRVELPDKATLARWQAVRELVDERTFSWSRLLADLERVLPWQVKLESIAPIHAGGAVRLRLSAVARNAQVAVDLARILESEGPFAQVYPLGVETTEEGTVHASYDAIYVPGKGAAAAPAAAAAAASAEDAGDAGDAGDEPAAEVEESADAAEPAPAPAPAPLTRPAGPPPKAEALRGRDLARPKPPISAASPDPRRLRPGAQTDVQ